jgi:adenylate cyclase
MAKIRFTISKKLNSLVVGLQVLTTIGIVVIATYLFSEELPGILRKSSVEASSLLGSRVRAEIMLVGDRMRSVGHASLEQFGGPEQKQRFLEDLIGADQQLFAISLYGFLKTDAIVKWRVLNKAFAGEQKLEFSDFDQIDRSHPISVAKLRAGYVQFSPGTLKGRATVRIAVPFQEDHGVYSQFLVAELYQERFSALFLESSAFSAFLIDPTGRVLASTEPNRSATAPIDPGIVGRLAGLQQQAIQFDYVDRNAKSQMAVLQPVGIGDLSVVVQSPYENVSNVKLRLYRRAGLLGVLAVSLAIWVAMLFSSSIKSSIERLAESARRVIAGDFTTRISLLPELSWFEGDEIEEVSRTFNRMVAGLEERNRVKLAFTKLHGSQLAAKMMSGNLKLGGERKNCIVFFSDIRGFTTMSEKIQPEHLVPLLNRYFEVMIGIVEAQNGTVTSIQGDGIMAVWGLDRLEPGDIDRAVEACLKMRVALAGFNETMIGEGRQPILIGMSLHYGPVVAGLVGSERRMEFTAIGDTTNTASRIESATKQFGTDFLVSGELLKMAKTIYLVEQVEAKLKGKKDQVTMFKILGYTDESEVQHIVRTRYSQFDPDKIDEAVFDATYVSSIFDPDEKTELTVRHVILNLVASENIDELDGTKLHRFG